VEERREIAKKAGETSMENRSPEERQEFARLGGQAGGKRRAQVLSPKRRAEIARNAAAARWGKKK
jgi:general stress protein YciG